MPMTPFNAFFLRFAIGIIGIAAIVGVLGRAVKPLAVNKPSPSDVILVVSGDYYGRMPLAMELYKAGYGKQIVVDEDASKSFYGQTLADRRKVEFARQSSPEVKVCPIYGATTSAESRDVAKCFESSQVQSALIVTSDFHTRRALSIMQFRMPAVRWSVAGSKSTFDLQRWWESRSGIATVVEEWMSLVYWKVVEQRRERRVQNT
jgi:uncharacterized SAM-binding protein YcdF (DUF218 family)